LVPIAVRSINAETVKIFLEDIAGVKLIAFILFPYLVKVVFEHFFVYSTTTT
tara:strand:- start:10 stop:165 length:156 start_codon:yes stop_codon:yes gene_type:complete